MVFFVSCSNNDNTTNDLPLSKTEILDVSYGTNSEQKYDIYLPEGRNSNTTKVILLIHGGGWVEGDKNDMNGYVTYLQSNLPDYAIVNINYRLASISNSPFPMQIDDIKSIFTQLEEEKEEYQISNNFGLIGVSAGAHLSLLYAYAHNNDKNIKMVCSIVGPTNFTDPSYTNATDPGFMVLFSSFQQIIGINYEDNIEYFESISPFHRVNSSSPPTLLFYGGEDLLIPTSQGTGIHQKLEDLGITNEFTLYPNEGHGWVGENLFDTATKIASFIVIHL
jgi:acetyl esterase/lipase